MKLKYKILLLFLIPINHINSQEIPAIYIQNEDSEKDLIYHNINILENSINSKNSKLLSLITTNRIKENEKTSYFSIMPEENIKIYVQEININSNSASVNCLLDIINSNSISKKIKNTFYLKKGKEWRFDDLEKLNQTVFNIIDNPNNKESQTEYNNVNIVYSDKTFIRYPFTTGGIFEINSDVTQQNLGVPLFAQGTIIDYAIFLINPSPPSSTAIFALDKNWERIIYSESGSTEIKSYGDHSNDFKFFLPTAIDVNEFGEIFVLDQYAKKIIKLIYSSATNSISSAVELNINPNILIQPNDIDYSSNILGFNKNDDFILVTDIGRKSILKFAVDGNLIEEFNKYQVNNIDYNINCPTRVTTTGDYIQFIDASQNLIISGGIGILPSTIVTTFGIPSKLPNISKPTDIGIDASHDLMVSDENLDLVHKFDFYGNYICSFKGITNFFAYPQIVCNSSYSYPGKVMIDFVINDRWSMTNGMKRYCPGADAVNLQVSEYSIYYKFDCLFTDILQYTLKLIRISDNYIVQSESGSTLWGGENKSFLVVKDYLDFNTNYKWEVSFLPYWNSNYGIYGVNWQSKEIVIQRLSGGVISSNTTWSGTKYIFGDVTVNNGVTLTISPGTNLFFMNKSSLIINGSLNADGFSENSKINFDFIVKDSRSQNGIRIYSGATANISEAIIKNAWYGIYANAVHSTINNCEVMNCDKGIYLYNTNSIGGQSSILNNNIHSNTYGIYLYKSSPNMRGNDIYNDNGSYGIFANTNSSPYLGDYELYGHNNIYGNHTGIQAYYNSNPFLGEEDCVINGGHNQIDNMYFNIRAELICNIKAEKNWWGTVPPSSSKFFEMDESSIDYTPYLSSQQSQKMALTNPEEIAYNELQYNFTEDKVKVTPVIFDHNWSIKRKLGFARSLIHLGKNEFAQKICKDIIREYPDSVLSFFALDILWEGSRHPNAGIQNNLIAFKGYLSEMMQNGLNKEIITAAGLILAGMNGSNGLNQLNQIITQYSGEQLGEIAMFQKFMYYLFEEKSMSGAFSVLTQLELLYPNSLSTKEAHGFIDTSITFPKFKFGNNENLTSLPTKYELLGNYPNPFNPSTIISFVLPYDSEIELIIYDIMGREIKIFAKHNQSAGYQNLTWDGKNNNGESLASGVYIYRIKAKSLNGNNEVFEKTAKLMLIK